MMTTAIMILTMASPLLVVAGLLVLAAWRDHRREAMVARQIRLTDALANELGPIVAIRETAVPGDQAVPDDERPRKRLEVSKFQEIPVRVELLVRFEVHPKAANGGRSGQ